MIGKILKIIKEILIMKLFGFFDNKCKGEVYPKEKVDTLLNGKSNNSHEHSFSTITGKPTTYPPNSHTHTEYKLKGDFAFLTGYISITSGAGSASVSYPSGFTKDNCVVQSLGIDWTGNGVINFVSAMGASAIYSQLFPSEIQVKANIYPGMGGGTTGNRLYKLVLMKI